MTGPTASCPNFVPATSGGTATGSNNANWSYTLSNGGLTDGHTYNVEVQATDGTTTGNTSGRLSAGTFTISETQPLGFYDGLDTPGSLGSTSPNNDVLAVALAAGQDGVEYNFGEVLGVLSADQRGRRCRTKPAGAAEHERSHMRRLGERGGGEGGGAP